MKILLIEDDENEGKLMAKYYLADHDVATARSFDDGLKAATANPPDIILLDLGFPGFSSETTIERIPELKVFAPVIVLTGMVSLPLQCLLAGAAAFFHKLEVAEKPAKLREAITELGSHHTEHL